MAEYEIDRNIHVVVAEPEPAEHYYKGDKIC